MFTKRPKQTWAPWYRNDDSAAIALASALRSRGHAVVMRQAHVLITRAPDGIEHGWHVRDVGPHVAWHVSRAVLLSLLEWRAAAADGRVAWLVHVAKHVDAPRKGVWVCGVAQWKEAARVWNSTCEPMAIDDALWTRAEDVLLTGESG